MVEVDSVSKWFGDLVAVSDVSFTIGPGVTALLGPNGAGKSTLLRLLTGQARPSSGSVQVLGGDPRSDADVRSQVGVLPQQEELFEHLRAERFVEIAATLQGLSDPLTAARRALEQVEMDPDDTRRVYTYSKGMRQRVKLAQAVVHEPRVVFLDEPLTGLDPRQRAHLVDLMHGLGAAGVCVLVSSHVLEEVERFGSDIIVIAQGRLAAQGDFHGIRALMDDRPMRVLLRSDQPSTLAGGLLEHGVVVGLQLGDDGEVVIDTDDARAFARTVAVVARERDVRLDEVVPLDDDLESVFRYLVDPR
jgi:ABC-2 type transport system ATP-binding protein